MHGRQGSTSVRLGSMARGCWLHGFEWFHAQQFGSGHLPWASVEARMNSRAIRMPRLDVRDRVLATSARVAKCLNSAIDGSRVPNCQHWRHEKTMRLGAIGRSSGAAVCAARRAISHAILSVVLSPGQSWTCLKHHASVLRSSFRTFRRSLTNSRICEWRDSSSGARNIDEGCTVATA